MIYNRNPSTRSNIVTMEITRPHNMTTQAARDWIEAQLLDYSASSVTRSATHTMSGKATLCTSRSR